MGVETPTRITGVTVETRVADRDVTVVFRSPYRWRIYDGDKDVTREFGQSRRGNTLPPHSPEWHAFHAETKRNERRSLIAVL